MTSCCHDNGWLAAAVRHEPTCWMIMERPLLSFPLPLPQKQRRKTRRRAASCPPVSYLAILSHSCHAHSDQGPITDQFRANYPGADSSLGFRIIPVRVSALCCVPDQSWWKLGVLLLEIDERALANSVLMGCTEHDWQVKRIQKDSVCQIIPSSLKLLMSLI